MGRGQRHSKNAGTMGSEGLSYHERKALGYGTAKERLGADSMGNYWDCCLTLQPAVDPVVTPEGFLFSKEAILTNLLAQKKAIKRKMAAWEAAQQEEAHKAAEKAAIEQQAEVIAFDRANHMGIAQETLASLRSAISQELDAAQQPGGAESAVAIQENKDRIKELKAFWMPSQQPVAKQTVEKPEADTLCPASGKKLRMKDLVPVKFTPIRESDKGDNEKWRHMDPLTKDTLTNVHKLVVLRPSGDVVQKETWEKLIKKEGSFNGHKIREDRDVIELKTGGTGFAARGGERVQASKNFMLGAGSGRQDLRGQIASSRSLGGLSIMN